MRASILLLLSPPRMPFPFELKVSTDSVLALRWNLVSLLFPVAGAAVAGLLGLRTLLREAGACPTTV